MYLISKSGLMASERKIRDTENLLFTMVSMAKILFIFFSPNKCLVKKEENVFLIVSFSWCHPFLQGRLCIAKILKKMLNSHRCVLEWITVLVTVCYILCCLILSTLHFRNDASILFFFSFKCASQSSFAQNICMFFTYQPPSQSFWRFSHQES